MKKISFYMFALAGLFLTACESDDYTDWADPQTNPQEETFTLPEFTATGAAEVIDLDVVETAQAFTLNYATLPEDVTLKDLSMVPVVDGVEKTDAAVKALDTEGTFSQADLQSLVKSVYGKKREEREVPVHVYLYADKGGTMLVDAGTTTVKILPQTPDFVAYYAVGTPNDWNNNDLGTFMIPVSEGIYEFTTKYTGSYDLKFIADDKLGTWTCWGGINGDNSPSGSLYEDVNSGAIASPAAGYYTFTADMNTETYTWTAVDNQTPTEYTKIGIIGGFNDWGGDVEMSQSAPHCWYATLTIANDTELKFRADGGWDVNWGAGITITEKNFYGVGEGNGPNINVPAGTYAFYFNDITGGFAIYKQ